MRAAGYIRVSTEEQRKHGWNLGADRERIEREVAECGWSLHTIYDDGGRQGDDPNRAGFLQMLSEVDEFDVLIMRDLDRFSRKLAIYASAVDDLVDAGVVLYEFAGDAGLKRLNLDDEDDRALADVKAVFAQLEKAKIRRRVRQGVRARIAAGKPMGALPGIGYAVEGEKPNSTRVVDESRRVAVIEMFERAEHGESLGAIARWLNAEGIRTRRGTAWNARTVRYIIDNPAFEGEKGYPPIVSHELAQRARDAVQRQDPAAVQRRKGGRPPKQPYMLRGIAFCAGCGAPLYLSHSYRRSGNGTYVCDHRMQSDGMCDRRAIAAEVLESHILNHLETFVASIEGWIAEKLRERDLEVRARQRALDAERTQLAVLDRQRDERMAELVEHGITSPIAFEVIERLDAQREAQTQRIADAEAKVSEFAGSPDVDAALDFYKRLVDAVQGRIKQATGMHELNDALSSVLAGLWCELDPDRDYKRLLVRFALREPGDMRLPDGSKPIFGAEYHSLPPMILDGYYPVETPTGLARQKTPQITTVSRMDHWLQRAAVLRPERTALERDGERLNYAQLLARARAGAAGLRAAGVRSGERVPLAEEDRFAFAAGLHGCLLHGAAAVPIDLRLTRAEQELRSAPGVALTPGTATIMHTSGTTSAPRPVELTLGNWQANALGSAVALGLDLDERWLCVMPLAHVGGLSILLRSTIYATTVVLHQRFDVEAVLAELMDPGRRITLVSLVPTMLARLLDAGLRSPPTLRWALLGGGPIPPGLLARAGSSGVPVAPTYGMTEACSQIATFGLPLTGVELRFEDGEIAVRGPVVAPGSLDPDGWLRTGDLGELDEGGRLRVVGRRADTIVSGGENIAPAEVENVLLEHPAVADAGVFARPDPEWGEAVVASVVLRDGLAAAPDDLQRFVGERLARFKVPKEIAFTTALPRTPSGKLLRRELG